MKIIRYVNTADMTIEFQDEHKYKTNTTYNNFKIGKIKNPYDKSIYGFGYIGEELTPHCFKGVCIPSFGAWTNMIERCYSEKLRHKHPAYEGCTICEDWSNYQVFRKWYDENWYDVGDGRMHLDKDIIKQGNKIYCPEYCVFVPQRINMIFMTKSRKDDLPTGITYNPIEKTYVSHYNGKRNGTYKTLEDAINEYNIQKQRHIEKVVKEYGDKIPCKVYNYLIKWKENLAA